jgi:hypothetical protein
VARRVPADVDDFAPRLHARGGQGKAQAKAKGSSCDPKHRRALMRRTLDPKPKQKEDGKFTLYENEWVYCNNLKIGDKSEVTDVSGCSVVYIWNSKNIPSIFHIFCGTQVPAAGSQADEQGDAALAAEKAGDTDCTPTYVTIAADSMRRYNEIKNAITKKFKEREGVELKETDFKEYIYNLDQLGPDKRFLFTNTAGSRTVEMSIIAASACSRQKSPQA